MATPTRPCPFCGAAVLMTAPACGTCGRPMPAAPAAPSGGPAKTMFGYAAPKIGPATSKPEAPAAPPAPEPVAPPPGFGGPPPGGPPPGGFGGPPPGGPPPGGFGGPPPGGPPPGFGGPPPGFSGPPPGFSGPPPGFSGPPPGGFGGPPPGGPPPGFGGPPPGGPPPGFGGPPPGGPPPGGFGGPPQGGPPPGGFGGPPQGGPPPQGFGGGGGPQPFAPPAQNLPGPMDDWARNLPQSKPGTLFGVPLSKLRDPSLQRMALMFLGIALAVAIFIPVSFSPKLTFAWKGHWFRGLVWPLLAAASYLFVSMAPANLRDKVPSVVREWLPFGVSFIGVIVNGIATISLGEGGLQLTFLYTIGISTLIFGLLARLQRPDDQAPRIIITVGASLVLLGIFAGDGIDRESRTITTNVLNHLDGDFGGGLFKGAMFKLYGLLFLLVCLVAAACAVFVVPARKLPPAMQAVDAFAPHVTAGLLVWLPVQIVLFLLAFLIHTEGVKFVEWFLMLVRSLLTLLAYFGVLMLTAPAAYDEIMKLVRGNKGPPQGPPQGGYGGPPQGGYGGPPQGGYGGPPQGGPPPGFGGPPQGGPPPGFGGPPQGGPPPGGWQPPQ